MTDPKLPNVTFKTAATMIALGPVAATLGAVPFVNLHQSGHTIPVTLDQAQLDRGIQAANAYTDTKVATLGGRLDVIDVRLRGVDDKLAIWSSVPTDLATLKERVSHLPTKDELGTKLRNYLAVAGVLFGIVGTVIGLGFRFLGHP